MLLISKTAAVLLTLQTKITKRLIILKKFFLQNRDDTSQKPCLVMGLDTSLYSTSSVQFSIVLLSTWLLSYESFHKHKDIMYVFHAKFNRKTNQMKISVFCCVSSTYILHMGRVKAQPTLALCNPA